MSLKTRVAKLELAQGNTGLPSLIIYFPDYETQEEALANWVAKTGRELRFDDVMFVQIVGMKPGKTNLE
ncbi:hypothetical protein [Methyloglobulus sp.]|uniref:hypothetical protein n=1 Tax=Methyloglobulus sp. TaxID=2518622 RepID=UPI003988C0C1